MTELRERTIGAMKLRNLADTTIATRPQSRKRRHTVRLNRTRPSGVSLCRYLESAVFTIDIPGRKRPDWCRALRRMNLRTQIGPRCGSIEQKSVYCNLPARSLPTVAEARRGSVPHVCYGNIWVRTEF
jgi:hypothetical protein